MKSTQSIRLTTGSPKRVGPRLAKLFSVTTGQRSVNIMLVIVFTVLVAAQQGFATRRDVTNDCTGKDPGKECKYQPGRESFVRNHDHKVVETDKGFAEHLQEYYTKASARPVDIVMQQCFGGGFLQYLNKWLSAYTIATASGWDECSFSDSKPKDEKPLTFLENFTRSWRKDAQLFSGDSLFDRFMLAANAGIKNAKIPPDRFAPPGWKDNKGHLWIERPQYQSPDKTPGGDNDKRPLLARGKGNRYAILVAWDSPDSLSPPPADRFAVDIARVNDTLRNVIGVPANNIVILYSNKRPGTVISPFNGGGTKGPFVGGDGDPNGNDLGTFTVNGPNVFGLWRAALLGKLFVNDKGTQGITYGKDDQLFIYFTGHGQFKEPTDLPSSDGSSLSYRIQLADGFDTEGNSNPDDPTELTNPDGDDLLQISTTTRIDDPSVELSVNGAPFGPLQDLEVTDPSLIYDLGDFVARPTYTYQVRIPHSLLGMNPEYATVGISNINDRNLVAAFSFSGGDQECLAVVPIN